MNWFSLLIPVILSIIEKFLKNREPKLVSGFEAGSALAEDPAANAFMTDAECAATAVQIKKVLDAAPKVQAGSVTHAGGVLAHLQELYAALTATPRDWVLIRTLLLDLLTHL